MNRRNFMKMSGLLVAGMAVGSTRASASFDGLIEGMKREAKTAPVRVLPIMPGFSMLENTGGNITVLNGKAATLLVDSGIAEQHPQIQKALEGMRQPPVMAVINTHWHFDHTSGNPWFRGNGVRITAHENTLKHLLVPTTVTPWRYTFEPIPVAGRPTDLVQGNSKVEVGKESASIHFVKHAHTDGDLMVHFEEADIISTGDIFWNGHYPFIDNETGGSIDGMISGAGLALKLSTPKTVFVPGHGPTASRADLLEYEEMLRSLRASVASLKTKGYTEADAIAAKPGKLFNSKYGDYAVGADDFVSLVFKGV